MIVPLEQHNPIKSIPWITYLLIVINSAIFLYFDTELSTNDYREFIKAYGFTVSSPDFQTAFNSLFLHVNFKHLIFNMYFLYMVGDNVEDVLKKPLYILSYLLTGFFAIFVYYIFNLESSITLIGASGAISGLLGLYAVMFPHTHMQFLWFYISAKQGVLFWFILQLVFALAFMNLEGGIAFSAHIGGFALGLVLGFTFKKIMEITPPIPDSILTFERELERDKIWCPHCGYEESSIEFGFYECSECGTKYEVTKVQRKFDDFFNHTPKNTSAKRQRSTESKNKSDDTFPYHHTRTKDLFED